MNERLILCGAGHLAWQLGAALKQAGLPIGQVWNRSAERGRELAAALDAGWTTSFRDLEPEATLILLCVSDDAIPGLAAAMKRDVPQLRRNVLLVHTAGAVDLDALDPSGTLDPDARRDPSGTVDRNAPHPSGTYPDRPASGPAFEHTGVLYPLMTFTRGRPVDFNTFPVCIEASNAMALERIRNLAGLLSPEIHHVSSTERLKLHLAAVIASNFSNHMYSLASAFLAAEQLDFALIRPLIQETSRKAMEMAPAAAQTGPAKRNDRQTLEAHLELLKDHPGLANLYTFVSDSITRYHRSE